MKCFVSIGYKRFVGGVLASALIIINLERAFAGNWDAAFDAATAAEAFNGWSGGYPIETAQGEARFDFEIPAEALAVALTRFQQITGLQVAVDSRSIAGARTGGARGTMTARDALVALLAGTPLTYRMADAATVAIAPAAGGTTGKAVSLPAIPVTAEGEETTTGPIEGYVAKEGATGTKTDTPIMETPQSVSVITRDQMDAQNVNDTGDVLRYTAGATAEPYGSDKRGLFFNLRGFNGSDDAFYRDGLQLRGSLFAGFTSLDPYGAERYELLKGPASVLYGQISPGGLLNYVTKRPTEEAFREVELESGYPARGGGAFDLGGPMSESGDLLFRLTGRGYHADSQVEYVDENRGYFAPALTWKPDDDTDITLLANFQYDRFGWSNQFLPASGTVLHNDHGQIPTSRLLSEPDWDDYEQYQVAFGYLAEHRLDETFTFRQNARYAHFYNDQRGVFGLGLEDDGRTYDRAGDSGVSSSHAVVVDTQMEVKVPTDVGIDQTVLVGVDFIRNAMDDYGASYEVATLDIFDPHYGESNFDSPEPYTDSDTVLRQIGFYAQDQVEIGDLTFVFGGRYDFAQVDTDDHLIEEVSKQRDEAFTGRVGAIYNFDFGLAPYASYSTSFNPTVGTDANSTPFEPSEGKQVEVGLKYQPPGYDALITVAGFQIYETNTLTTDPDDPNFSVQRGEIRSRGIEVEAKTSLEFGLDLTLAYSFTEVELTKDEDGNKGNTPSATPRHRASLWGDYTIKQGDFANLGFGAGLRYTGESYGDDANSFEVADYAVVDAAIHYDYEAMTFAINATNLFNKKYVAACVDGDSGCYYGERLQVIGTVKYRW
jgi:iron complex outermembrane receptor protein